MSGQAGSTQAWNPMGGYGMSNPMGGYGMSNLYGSAFGRQPLMNPYAQQNTYNPWGGKMGGYGVNPWLGMQAYGNGQQSMQRQAVGATQPMTRYSGEAYDSTPAATQWAAPDLWYIERGLTPPSTTAAASADPALGADGLEHRY